MKIVFVSNHIHHHQYPLAAELYRLTGGSYRFVEMQPLADEFKRNGYPQYPDTDWILRAWESDANMELARKLAVESDVMMYGGIYPFEWIRERLDNGKITFEVGERWLKRGLLNLLSPRLLKHQWWYHRHFSDKPLYRLNAGAYAAPDMRLLRSFRNKCFKWGYFTSTAGCGSPETVSRSGPVRFIWCARLIPLKHPELIIGLAKELKKQNLDFVIDIYGDGELRPELESTIKQSGLTKNVVLRGNLPNAELLRRMEESEIFLFTSDRHEGWGAVVNEAMSRGCAVVCSEAAGCAPWLIREGETGYTFRTGSLSDLTAKVMQLMHDKRKRQAMRKAAADFISSQWSPETAAARFLNLIENLEKGLPSPYADGVCSPD